MPCLSLVLVERLISNDETRQSRNARRRGQINRYKANDLAMILLFFYGSFPPFVYWWNKYDKATEALSLIHGHCYDDLEPFDPIYRMAEFLEEVPD